MKMMKTLMVAAGVMMTMAVALPSVSVAQTAAAPAAASAPPDTRNFTPGPIWTTSHIEILPGQGTNYLAHLRNNYKPDMEFMKAQGWLLSYHILSVNSRREGEPNLIILEQWRDQFTTAQSEEIRNRMRARTPMTDAQSMARGADLRLMRKTTGGMELRELMLK